MLLLSAGLAAALLQRGYGWLDRVVQFQKNKFFNEVKELAPVNINVEVRPKPEGYEDSRDWDYDSVLRLLTLIRESESAKPVHKALRRILQPTRRLMMSVNESLHRFPSIKDNYDDFYYDVDYPSAEENFTFPAPKVPKDTEIIIVSNPVEARLPSAQISVKLLRKIMEARARAARKMPTTTEVVPWKEFIKNRTKTTASTNSTTPGTEETGETGTETTAEGETASEDGTTDENAETPSEESTPEETTGDDS